MLVLTTLRNDMRLIEQHYREALELRAKGAMDEEALERTRPLPRLRCSWWQWMA